MGRGKIEIKRIENSSNRQVTYSKRRNGIIKKAKEITVLCEAKVSLVIFNNTGKMNEYCSPDTTVIDILEEYHKLSGKRLWDAKHENLNNEIERIKKENDNMQIELRHLKGEDITSLEYRELMNIEEALENGLTGVRQKKVMILINVYQLKHSFYSFIQQHQQMDIENNAREMNNGYQRVRDYNVNSQMPFAFRVQPIQPNLQDRI
ncbi:SRF-TF domain-containing protein/K-box domain-containing protein, partial [Cephalotus follicularis]